MELGEGTCPLPEEEQLPDVRASGRVGRASPSSSRSVSPVHSETAVDLPSTPSTPASKPKRRIKAHPLPRDQEQKMLEWLEANEILWSNKHMDYKDTQRKSCLWEAQAKVIGQGSQHLKSWWKAIRDSYTRLHKCL